MKSIVTVPKADCSMDLPKSLVFLFIPSSPRVSLSSYAVVAFSGGSFLSINSGETWALPSSPGNGCWAYVAGSNFRCYRASDLKFSVMLTMNESHKYPHECFLDPRVNKSFTF